MDDFTIYEGVDIVPYVAVTSDGTEEGTPIALDTWTAATWVAFPYPYTGPTQTPAILKHMADMTIGTDPLASGSSVNNCIFTPLSNQDVGDLIGQFRYECRVALGTIQYVVYPLVGIQATFTIDDSLTWNPNATPDPTPRLVRLEGHTDSVERHKQMPPAKINATLGVDRDEELTLARKNNPNFTAEELEKARSRFGGKK